MKKVVIDGMFLRFPINGIPRYAMEVVKAMDMLLSDENLEVILCYPDDIPLEKLPNLKNISPLCLKSKIKKGWNILHAEAYARKNKALYLDLMSRGCFYKNSVICLHDIRPLTWDLESGNKVFKFYRNKINFDLIAKNAKLVVTVSDFCKKEIAAYYNIPESKLLITPEGWEHLNRIPDLTNPPKVQNFYFTIGSMAPHKNFEWVINTAKNNPESKFLIAGGVDPKIWNYQADFSVAQNVKFLGYISDEEMKWYMQHAKALLLPSFYEGFGIPPLEALALGTPVIASDIPVLHEIFGGTVHYINPMDYNVNLDALLQEPVEPADKVLKKETWENAAKFWIDVIKDNS